MRRLSVSTPSNVVKLSNGAWQPPTSRRICTRDLRIMAGAPRSAYTSPWYEASGSVKFGKRPLVQSKVPPSTIAPPIAVPCPLRNLVVLCVTMCAPHSNGRHR